MAPIAITPPAIELKSLNLATSKSTTANTSSKIGSRKIICFPDFDGTIFMQDTGHILFNTFSCGSDRRQVLDQQTHTGERSFRDVSEELELTPHRYYVANPKDGHSWKPVWLHDCELGHDEAKSINDYKSTARLESSDSTVPLVVFIGDGVSDLPVAREADVLFARRGLRLEEEIIKIAKDEEKTKGKGMPANSNPRANLWRRASSKAALPVFAMMSPKTAKVIEWPNIVGKLSTPLELPEGAAVAAPAAQLGERPIDI
ncbi:hypothetical protein CC80DRAFT_515287 [Byssothecium circinans]|uniref:HAD-like protein n=1 Tax=Byssothecium circinans TaxID=147558 RepID=A0A6A5U9H1_9PLEO|nr:hypothetical protein CC80DRAFT_515287 [Byssothecium circinans]